MKILFFCQLHCFNKNDSTDGVRCVCVCVYFCSPVRAVCPNHEVVVFQPRKGTTPYLRSVANSKFYYSPTAPPVSTVFLDLFIYPLYPTPPPCQSDSQSPTESESTQSQNMVTRAQNANTCTKCQYVVVLLTTI